jgi:hypothetical protein
MTTKETIALNFFPSDMKITSGLTEHEKNTVLASIYKALTKYVASKNFAIFPYRAGVRFFADRNCSINIAGREHPLVHVEEWSGRINEIRFHDGFMIQVELIDETVWLKIDPRQLVLIKGNEQTRADYTRSFYASYCPFSNCENRKNCLLCRPKIFRVESVSNNDEQVNQLNENLDYGCKFFESRRGKSSVIETKFHGKQLLLPERMAYYKGAITDMPNYSLRKLYQKRCLLKSDARLALTQYVFSVLSDSQDSFSVIDPKNHVNMKIENMFESEIES